MARAIWQVTSRIYAGPLGTGIARRLDDNRGVTRPRIELSRGERALDGLQIAFVSDVHAGNFMNEADLVRLFGCVAATAPDLVCLGGDTIDYFADQSLLLREGLALLDPPLGVWAVPGNHEYRSDPDLGTWRSVLRDAGVEILLNRGTRLRWGAATLWLAGVDDLTEGEPDLERALDGREEDEPCVLLSHHPDFFEEARLAEVDLVLSGHTHGGQIVPLGKRLSSHTRLGFWSGRFETDGCQLYVSRGAGVGFLPLRIGAPGELALIELRVKG